MLRVWSLSTGSSPHALAVGFADAIKRRELQKASEMELAWAGRALSEVRPADIRRKWLEEHLESQGHRCAYCQTPIALAPHGNDGRATIDHRVARSKGGADVKENTVAACATCNTLKADGTEDELYVKPEFRIHLAQSVRL